MTRNKKLLLGALATVLSVACVTGTALSVSAEATEGAATTPAGVVIAEDAECVTVFNPDSVDSDEYTEFCAWGTDTTELSGLTVFAPEGETGVSYDFAVCDRTLQGVNFATPADVTAAGAAESDVVFAFNLYISDYSLIDLFKSNDAGIYFSSYEGNNGWSLSNSQEMLFSSLKTAGLAEGWNRVYFNLAASNIRSGLDLTSVRQIVFVLQRSPDQGAPFAAGSVVLNNVRAYGVNAVTKNGSPLTGIEVEPFSPEVGTRKTFLDTSVADVQYAGGATTVAQKSDFVPYEYKDDAFAALADDSYKLNFSSANFMTWLRAANREEGFNIGSFNLNRSYLETYVYLDAENFEKVNDSSNYGEAYVQVTYNISRYNVNGVLGGDNNPGSVYFKWSLATLNLQEGWNKVRLGFDLSFSGIVGSRGAGMQKFSANMYSFDLTFSQLTTEIELYMTDIDMVQGDISTIAYIDDEATNSNAYNAAMKNDAAYASSSILPAIATIETEYTAGDVEEDGYDYTVTLTDDATWNVEAAFKLGDETEISSAALAQVGTLKLRKGDSANVEIDGLTATFKKNGEYSMTLGNTLNNVSVVISVTVDVNYAVTFSGATIDAQEIAVGEKATKPATDPVWTGEGNYEFDGWYADDGYTTEFDFDTAITQDTVIYAKWANLYTVAFNGADTAAQYVKSGSKAEKPGDPEWTGTGNYAFAGWYTSDAYTTEFDFDTAITEDVTVYAKWDEVRTVTAEGAGITLPPVKVGEKLERPADPVRTDGKYAFLGWFADAEHTVAFDFDTPITADTTIYAAWAQIFTVTLDTDGGALAADSVDVQSGKMLALADYVPEKEGYDFAGWKAGETSYASADSVTVTQDMTLVAQWTKKQQGGGNLGVKIALPIVAAVIVAAVVTFVVVRKKKAGKKNIAETTESDDKNDSDDSEN